MTSTHRWVMSQLCHVVPALEVDTTTALMTTKAQSSKMCAATPRHAFRKQLLRIWVAQQLIHSITIIPITLLPHSLCWIHATSAKTMPSAVLMALCVKRIHHGYRYGRSITLQVNSTLLALNMDNLALTEFLAAVVIPTLPSKAMILTLS